MPYILIKPNLKNPYYSNELDFLFDKTNPYLWQISEDLSVGHPWNILNLESCTCREILVFFLVQKG